MKHIFLFFLIGSVALFSGCDTKKKSLDTSNNITPVVEKTITIFGSENCDHCIDFRNKLDSVNINYEFKDAEAEEKHYNELVRKIQQANYRGYIEFPVLDVDGKIYVRPEFSEFIKILKQ